MQKDNDNRLMHVFVRCFSYCTGDYRRTKWEDYHQCWVGMEAEENVCGLLQRHMLIFVWRERESHEELSQARLEEHYRSSQLTEVCELPGQLSAFWIGTSC